MIAIAIYSDPKASCTFLAVIRSIAKKCSKRVTPLLGNIGKQSIFNRLASNILHMEYSTLTMSLLLFQEKYAHHPNWKKRLPFPQDLGYEQDHHAEFPVRPPDQRPSPASRVSSTCFSRSSLAEVTAAMPP